MMMSSSKSRLLTPSTYFKRGRMISSIFGIRSGIKMLFSPIVLMIFQHLFIKILVGTFFWAYLSICMLIMLSPSRIKGVDYLKSVKLYCRIIK